MSVGPFRLGERFNLLKNKTDTFCGVFLAAAFHQLLPRRPGITRLPLQDTFLASDQDNSSHVPVSQSTLILVFEKTGQKSLF